MVNELEKMAVNSWKTTCLFSNSLPEIKNKWQSVSDQFFGCKRLALFINDAEAADLAEFLADIALQRKQ